jgi:hypothetical protein
MKTFKIESWGVIDNYVQRIIDTYKDKPATKDAIFCLNEDITFVVCKLGVAHGNLNKYSKTGWLSPRNNDNSFNVCITF